MKIHVVIGFKRVCVESSPMRSESSVVRKHSVKRNARAPVRAMSVANDNTRHIPPMTGYMVYECACVRACVLGIVGSRGTTKKLR